MNTINIINNIDIELLFQSYSGLIKNNITLKKYYISKGDSINNLFVDFIFDFYLDQKQDFFWDKFDDFQTHIFHTPSTSVIHFLSQEYKCKKYELISLKQKINRNREYYHINFDDSILDYKIDNRYKIGLGVNEYRDQLKNICAPYPIEITFGNIAVCRNFSIQKEIGPWDIISLTHNFNHLSPQNGILFRIYQIWLRYHRFYLTYDDNSLFNFFDKYEIKTLEKNKNLGARSVLCASTYLDTSDDSEINREIPNNLLDMYNLGNIFIELIEAIKPEIKTMYQDKFFI
jgi:hypothetical protein